MVHLNKVQEAFNNKHLPNTTYFTKIENIIFSKKIRTIVCRIFPVFYDLSHLHCKQKPQKGYQIHYKKHD